MGAPNTLLVGESNPYQTDPRLAQRYALFPHPPRCAGWNLCHRIMRLDEAEYLRRFDRVNLCDGNWSAKEAKSRARVLCETHHVIVMFGAKVTRAFDFPFKPFTDWGGHPQFVCLPHPSGLSRAWNEPGALDKARSVLREAGVL